MKFTPSLRLINNTAVDALKKKISGSISQAPQLINSIKEEKKKVVYERFVLLNKWYTKVIGLDEIKISQDRVSQLQDQLLDTQEKRREKGKELAELRQKLIELHDQIHKVNRQSEFDKFFELMKNESELLKEERAVSLTFQDYDQRERELFTGFANAIRDSHEKQRAQAEYTKYFGLVLSIAGSFLAFVYTTVKKQDIKIFIEEKLASLDLSKQPVNVNLDLTSDPVMKNLIMINQHIQAELRVNRGTLNNLIDVLNKQASSGDTKKENIINRFEKVNPSPLYGKENASNDFQNVNTSTEILHSEENLGIKILCGIAVLWVISKIFS